MAGMVIQPVRIVEAKCLGAVVVKSIQVTAVSTTEPVCAAEITLDFL